MIAQEILTVLSEEPIGYVDVEFDTLLTILCDLVLKGQEINPDYYGMVAAALVDPDNRVVGSTSYNINGKWCHAERAAIEKYKEKYGSLPKGCSIVTTLSPCSESMNNRYGSSCEDLITDLGIDDVYCGYQDPTQNSRYSICENPKINQLCKQLADTFLKENFHNGKVKGKSRPGRVKRAGASCAGSVTSLRAKAKKASGERAKMYHWCANMKSGKKK